VVFLSFISPRTSCRYDPTQVAPQRADHNNLYVAQKSEHHVAHFAFSIGSPNDRWAIEYEAHIVEVDLPIAQSSFALVVVPAKSANICEQCRVIVFDHGHSPR
jgi:hypothetical protein